MKIHILASVVALSLVPSGIIMAADNAPATGQAKEIRLLIYGHVYDTDKNHPVRNMRVYTKKDGKELESGKTDPSGQFQLVGANREDFINLCVESTEFSSLKNVSLCETVSIFQKVGTVVDGVEVRELEHDFFTNQKGDNLNQALIDEKTHGDDEAQFSEYQKNVDFYKDQQEKEKANLELQKKLDAEKARYRMPANTEMTGPLKRIQVILSIANGRTSSGSETSSGGTSLLLPQETTISIYTHDGELLREAKLSQVYDANVTIVPKGEDPVFLNPLIMVIENGQTKDFQGQKVPMFRKAAFQLTREKNIINVALEENNPGYMDRTIEKREGFPAISIILLLSLITGTLLVALKNKVDNQRHDYV